MAAAAYSLTGLSPRPAGSRKRIVRVTLPYRPAAVTDEYATGRALPHAAQDRWIRPYRPGPWRVGDRGAGADAGLVSAVRRADHGAGRRHSGAVTVL